VAKWNVLVQEQPQASPGRLE